MLCSRRWSHCSPSFRYALARLFGNQVAYIRPSHFDIQLLCFTLIFTRSFKNVFLLNIINSNADKHLTKTPATGDKFSYETSWDCIFLRMLSRQKCEYNKCKHSGKAVKYTHSLSWRTTTYSCPNQIILFQREDVYLCNLKIRTTVVCQITSECHIIYNPCHALQKSFCNVLFTKFVSYYFT